MERDSACMRMCVCKKEREKDSTVMESSGKETLPFVVNRHIKYKAIITPNSDRFFIFYQ